MRDQYEYCTRAKEYGQANKHERVSGDLAPELSGDGNFEGWHEEDSNDARSCQNIAVRVLSKLLKNMITPEGLTKETGHGTSLSYTN
jgi:hypothetical protein